MKSFASSSLLGDIVKALGTDINQEFTGARFACRPLMARTSENDTALGRFKGRIGMPNLAEFKTSIDEMVTENMVKVILDFAAASLSPSAVGALVELAATMHGRNKRLYIYRPSEQIRNSLEELGLTHYFSYLEDEDDILATLVV